MNSIRHIVASVLLGMFIAVQFLPSIIQRSINIHQTNVKKNIQQNKNNVFLSFSNQEWNQVKKVRNDEIEIDGKLFDIQSKIEVDGRVLIRGHYDTKEDHLLAMNKNLKKKSQNLEKQNAAFSVLFLETIIDYNFFQPCLITNYQIAASKQAQKMFLQKSSPPPKV